MASLCVRTCSSLNLYPLSVRICNSSVLSVRWRKPRWVPKTQSKLFYVREPTSREEDESKMMKEKYAFYRTQMKAIRSYFHKVGQEEKEARREYEMIVEAEQDMAKAKIAVEKNNHWNEQSAKLREARELAEAQSEAKSKAVEYQKKKEREQHVLAEIQTKIDENIKSSKKFITLENLDEEIEKVLDSRTDFNFPINQEGQIVRRKTKPKQEKSSEPDS